jgi:hypothetical protein
VKPAHSNKSDEVGERTKFPWGRHKDNTRASIIPPAYDCARNLDRLRQRAHIAAVSSKSAKSWSPPPSTSKSGKFSEAVLVTPEAPTDSWTIYRPPQIVFNLGRPAVRHRASRDWRGHRSGQSKVPSPRAAAADFARTRRSRPVFVHECSFVDIDVGCGSPEEIFERFDFRSGFFLSLAREAGRRPQDHNVLAHDCNGHGAIGHFRVGASNREIGFGGSELRDAVNRAGRCDRRQSNQTSFAGKGQPQNLNQLVVVASRRQFAALLAAT